MEHERNRYFRVSSLFFNSFLLYSLQHGAAVIQDKMYVYGGNHNGRYLGDLHVSNISHSMIGLTDQIEYLVSVLPTFENLLLLFTVTRLLTIRKHVSCEWCFKYRF